MSDDKKKLREYLRKNLKEKHHELNKFDAKLSLNLKNLISNIKIQKSYDGLVIGGFAPHFEEPHWYKCFDGSEGKLTLVHMHKDLSLTYHLADFENLAKGSFSLELSEEQRAIVAKPDIVLVPGLGFSKKKERIGRGKGYFDRFLENFRGTSVGVFYEYQICEELFSEATDQKLDFIVTEKNVYH